MQFVRHGELQEFGGFSSEGDPISPSTGRSWVKDRDGSPAPPFRNHVTIVLAKHGDTWWAEAAQQVIYAPPPGAPK